VTDGPFERLGPISGRARDVSVTVTDLSFRQTGSGRQYPYPDFGSEFIEAIHKALLAPRRKGLLRSTLACPSCESSLEGLTAGPVSVSTEIALTRIPPVRVEIEMPGLRCPGCGRSLVRIDERSVDSDLSDALIDAFASASLVPG
jgi:hypothetical protein